MKHDIAIILTFLLLPATLSATPAIGTTSAEVRKADKRIDIPKTIDALTKLGANTFYYLVWQGDHDWDDLPAFADAAEKRDIDIWVYIVPWSETPPNKKNGWGYSEPFRNDYITWATEIAKLSLRHRNIVGYVIDDFYDNTELEHFSPTYIRRMTTAAKRINPKIKFYPLMYFQTPWAEFIERFSTLVDGVVICYPKSEAGIRNALTYLDDRRHGPSAIMELPRHRNANRGDGASIYADLTFTDPDEAEISFYYDVTDQIAGNNSSQMARMKIDGKVVWESPTEARMRDGVINIPLYRYVKSRRRVKLQLDVVTQQGGTPENLPVTVRFDDIRIYGTGKNPDRFATDTTWHGDTDGKFELKVLPASADSGRFHLPTMLMPAGEPDSFKKRFDMAGTPTNIANKVRVCLNLLNEKLIEGVVLYRTPLDPDSDVFEAMRREFSKFVKQQSQGVNQAD